jgi:putative membrane protein
MNGQTDLSHPKTPGEYLRVFFSGFAMGSADIVPGVSGGTMAFILGIYETLINAIKSFNLDAIRKALKFDLEGVLNQIPFRFLIALGLGLGTAVLLISNILHGLLENQPTFIFAFFAGLIIASIVAIGIKVRWEPVAVVALVVAAAFAFVIVGFNADEPETVVETNTQLESAAAVETVEIEEAYVPSPPLTLFFSGMIAICAMLLPGISGSFILLILGQYAAVLGAVSNLHLVSIAAVGAGAAIGIIAFSRVISWLLKHHENVTIAALVGFMLGSLRLIYDEAVGGIDVITGGEAFDEAQWGLVALLLIGGFLLVSLLDHLQSRTNPVFAWFWKPAPGIDMIGEKAEALD